MSFKTISLLPFLLLIHSSLQCDILGATGCPKEPEAALKNEEFLEYCDQYKSHLECVFEMYEGCDRKGKYAMAMKSMVKGLNKKIHKLEKLCERDFGITGLDETDEESESGSQNIQINTTRQQKRRKRPTTITREENETTVVATNIESTTTTTTTTTLEPCEIDMISTECYPILKSVQYISSWSDQVKTKWCNSATPYVNCIKMRMFNCENSSKYAESFEYFNKIRNYVENESNKSCPGGIEGCIVNPDDSRCRQGPKFKNMIDLNDSNSSTKLNKLSLLFYNLIFIFCYNLQKKI